MTKTTPDTAVKADPPGKNTSPVLFESAETAVLKMKDEPGTWWLIAGGDVSRTRTLFQTAYRIRTGQLKAFVVTEETGFGTWQTLMSSDKSVPDRAFPVELYCRWVPADWEDPESIPAEPESTAEPNED